MRSLLKVPIGLLLFWAGTSMALVTGHALGRLPWTEMGTLVFGIGFFSYLFIHFLFYKPILSHVMAHELTHALAAVLMGGKVTSIHASTTGGTTVVNRSNIFVSLAPYVFPLYTALALVLYAVSAASFRTFFLGLVGFTYAFHLALTFYSLSHHQPDLKEGGVVFSLIFIFTGNMIVLMLLIAALWPQTLSFSQALSQSAQEAWSLAGSLFRFVQPHLPRSGGSPS